MATSTALKLVLLFTALLAAVAQAADAQTCALCWEQAQSLTFQPICARIFDSNKLDECLCKPGNIDVFRGCDPQCDGITDRYPSSICATLRSKRDADPEPQIMALTPYKHEEDDIAAPIRNIARVPAAFHYVASLIQECEDTGLRNCLTLMSPSEADINRAADNSLKVHATEGKRNNNATLLAKSDAVPRFSVASAIFGSLIACLFAFL